MKVTNWTNGLFLKKINSKIKNQMGMSIVEILVAVGILSIVIFGVTTMMSDTLKMTKNTSLKNEFNSLINQVQLNLNNSSNCVQAFGGPGTLKLTAIAPPSPWAANVSKVLNSDVSLTVGGTNIQKNIKYGSTLSISSVQFSTAVTTATADQYRVPLVIKASRLANNTSGGELTHTFDLYLTLDATKGVIACAGQFTNFWNDATNTSAADKRIYFDGDIGIRKNTISANIALDVNGAAQATAFMYASDSRLKENIRDIQGPLESVLRLHGVIFDWKDKTLYNNKNQIGLLAQEVEKIFPQAVYTDESTGLKSVAYANLIAPLIEAIKKQQDIINQQQSEIELIKQELNRK